MFKISEILEFLPKKLFLTLLIILGIVIFIPYVLNHFTTLNQNKINEIKGKITNFSNEYETILKQDKYQAILQFITIGHLLNNKKYLTKIIANLPKYLPKNLNISEVNIDTINNKIALRGSLPNWLEYAKAIQYFKENPNIFPDLKIENLQFDKEKYTVNLVINFTIPYQELYK